MLACCHIKFSRSDIVVGTSRAEGRLARRARCNRSTYSNDTTYLRLQRCLPAGEGAVAGEGRYGRDHDQKIIYLTPGGRIDPESCFLVCHILNRSGFLKGKWLLSPLVCYVMKGLCFVQIPKKPSLDT